MAQVDVSPLGPPEPPSPIDAGAQERPASPRSWTLDLLRGLAVLLVLGRHIPDPDRSLRAPPPVALRLWHQFGWAGVDLFFVLSGFLVAGLLFSEYQRHGQLRPLRFLARRGFKIYPGFYVMLAVTWLWLHKRFDSAVFIDEALFIQNYTQMIWGHTWSLAVEEHFYVGLALALWWTARRTGGANPFRRVPLVFAVVAAAALTLRVQTFSSKPQLWLITPTHLRIDSLLFGTLLSYLWSFHRAAWEPVVRRLRIPIALASVLLLLPSILLPLEWSFVVNTIGFTTNYLGFGGFVLLAAAARDRPRSIPRALARPVCLVGLYSYSIYLWHVPLRHLVSALRGPTFDWYTKVALFLAVSILFGIAAGFLIERPFLYLRDRLVRSRA